MADAIKANLEKGRTSSGFANVLNESNPLDMGYLHKWRDPINYNTTLAHYMALYDKSDELIKYFSTLERSDFQNLLSSTESFGSTFLHSAAGINNSEFLQVVFEKV